MVLEGLSTYCLMIRPLVWEVVIFVLLERAFSDAKHSLKVVGIYSKGTDRSYRLASNQDLQIWQVKVDFCNAIAAGVLLHWHWFRPSKNLNVSYNRRMICRRKHGCFTP